MARHPLHHAGLMLALAVCLAACATSPKSTTYEQLGGAAGVEGIVDALLEKRFISQLRGMRLGS